ncbi:acid proteinase [Cryphonectria parasitica EP155]|uniref:Acid proteinase n=1 Tax=Cryphonectria parasitica (strain ATCC 38755 / EP155) TaxID=660469 RepID=A0A9P4Y5D0_CRYP1|nr:acid proteinase [Cryphonectria parasitica EP155]KAF3767008.1 acid proteinase [Cryphonectria parasitica EP155]
MKYATVVAALLGANAALGARFTEKRRERNEARLARRSGSVRLPATNSEGVAIDAAESRNDTTNVEYSSNWAGAVLIGSGYKSVTGTFVVPTPKSPGSGNTEYAASAWVGIDGDTAQNSILQTGVDFYVEGSSVAYDAWYEWYPDYAYDFSGISISAGDTIKVTVTATTTTSGTAVVENVTKGTTVTHTFTGQSAALQELNAEWIVEDFEEGDELVPFANFGTVTFTGAEATTSSGTVTAADATLIDIEQNGEVLTSVTVSGSTVTVKYV